MKRTIISIIFIIIVFITITVVESIHIINGDDFYKSFKIISVDNISTNFHIKFEKLKAADEYQIVVYNDDNTVLWSEKTKKNDMFINLKRIQTDKTYQIIVIAYNKAGLNITAENPYTFTYNEPTFNQNNSILLNNDENYYLLIDGDLTKKDYYIEIKDDKKTYKKERITDNEYTIDKSIYCNKENIYTINLYDNNTIIHSLKLYSNISPIDDLTIIEPQNDIILNYSDIPLSFDGGNNATEYLLQIFREDTMIKETPINNNNIVISKDFFKKSENYTLKILAKYEDMEKYTKTDSIKFTINDKDTLRRAYFSSFNNKKVELYNPNNSGKIYYTLDGSDPSEKGIEYKEPIEINEKVNIKTIVKDKNKNNSIITDDVIGLDPQDSYTIYINTNTTNENTEDLNELVRLITTKLEEKSIKVIRNNPDNSLNKSMSEAKTNNADLYLSLKTSASISHESYGIETWINNEDSKTFSIANLIHNSIIKNYYDSKGNKGIKFSFNNIEELTDHNVPISMIINLGYFDNEKDYDWLTSNKEIIADSISKPIIDYFSIK